MHDARHIANYFIEKKDPDGEPFTHLQIQKLVYYAHAWMLALFDEPMIEDEIEVWRYGPVVPSVYYCLSHNRGGPVTATIPIHPEDNKKFTTKQSSLLEAVYERYGPMSGMELSALTHQKGTPWQQAKSKHKLYIPNESIHRYYSKLAKQA